MSNFGKVAGTSQWAAMGSQDTLEETVETIVLHRAQDDSTWTFNYFTGRVLSMRSREGWTYTYAYTNGLLTQVTNQFGRKLTFTYDSQNRMATASLAGMTVTYAYDAGGRLSSATYPDGGSVTYLYEDGRWPDAITGVVDESGQRWANVAYDDQGRAVQSELAGAADRSVVAYASGSTSVTDGLGFTRTYQYQPLTGAAIGLATTAASAPSAEGSTLSSQVFDSQSLLSSQTDFLGITTMFTWDTSRRLPATVTEAVGSAEARATQYTWHSSFRLPLTETVGSRTTTYSYDTAGRLVGQVVSDVATGSSRTWSWAYGANGLVATMTDPRGGIWRYGYDVAGNRTSVQDPLSRTTSMTYDAAGRITNRTDPGGLVTASTYDARGRLVSVQVGSETTTYTWHPTGKLATATLPSGYQVSYGYDAAQRLVSATDNRGASIIYTLDALGNRVREEVRGDGAIARVTSRVVNSLNQVTGVQGAAGQNSQIAYDANGQPTSSTDPLNQTTRLAHDGLGRTTSTTFADNATTSNGWNALDQLTQFVDAKGVSTTYTYNTFGDVMSESSPDAGTIIYERDGSGQVTSARDAKGQITQINRDALGRPTAITYADGAQVSFTWNQAGYLDQVQDRSGTTQFSRDVQGRVASKTQTVNDNPAAPSQYGVQYGRTQGQLASVTYPSGLRIGYVRDGVGRITGIDVQPPVPAGQTPGPAAPFVSQLTYTALGQPRSWAWNNGAQTMRTFDSDGRMTYNEFATYVYDSAGRLTGGTQKLLAQEQVQQPDGVAVQLYTTTLPWSAQYDNRDRLTSFILGGAQTQYTYDPNSNRLTAILRSGTESDLEGQFEQLGLSTMVTQTLAVPGQSNRLQGLTQTATTTQSGQVTSEVTTQQNYEIDANGSMVSDGQRGFEYDASGRLAKVTLQQGGEAASVRYQYNALGQRVFKSEVVATQTAPQESTLGASFVEWLQQQFSWLFTPSSSNATLGQAYIYGDGELPSWALLGEYGNGGGTVNTDYIWLPLEGGGAIPVGMYRQGGFYAIHTDHLGTPRLVTDSTTRPVWQWPYSAFGQNKPTGVLQTATNPATNQPVLQGTQPQVPLNLRFPGQYFDSEVGSFYNYFRDYDAQQGRYRQADPIGLEGGGNRFAYVDGATLAFTDPLGLLRPTGWLWLDRVMTPYDTRHCATPECAAGFRETAPIAKAMDTQGLTCTVRGGLGVGGVIQFNTVKGVTYVGAGVVTGLSASVTGGGMSLVTGAGATGPAVVISGSFGNGVAGVSASTSINTRGTTSTASPGVGTIGISFGATIGYKP